MTRSRNYGDDARRLARLARPCCPAQAHPVVRPTDRRRRPDGSAPRREPWGASGLRGVYRTPEGRWAAKVRHAGRVHYAGTFDGRDEAARAVAAKLAELAAEGGAR